MCSRRLPGTWEISSYDAFLRIMFFTPFASAARNTDAGGPALRWFNRHRFGRGQSDNNQSGFQCDQLDLAVAGGVFSETDVAEVRFDLALWTV